MASGHLAHQHLGDEGGVVSAPKRRKMGTRVERARGVATQFKQTDVSDVTQVSGCGLTCGCGLEIIISSIVKCIDNGMVKWVSSLL